MAWGYPDEPEHVIAGTAIHQRRRRIHCISSLGSWPVAVLLIAGVSDRFVAVLLSFWGPPGTWIFHWHSYAQTILSLMPVALAGARPPVLDAGTYPQLDGASPSSPPSTANILIVICLGGNLLPIIISLLVWANVVCWSFLLAGAIALTACFITLPFSNLSSSDIETRVRKRLLQAYIIAPHRSDQLQPLCGWHIRWQPFYLISQWFGAVWTVRRRRMSYTQSIKSVKYLYLYCAFITAPLVRKQFALPHY